MIIYHIYITLDYSDSIDAMCSIGLSCDCWRRFSGSSHSDAPRCSGCIFCSLAISFDESVWAFSHCNGFSCRVCVCVSLFFCFRVHLSEYRMRSTFIIYHCTSNNIGAVQAKYRPLNIYENAMHPAYNVLGNCVKYCMFPWWLWYCVDWISVIDS